jgi:hypothetical protein
MYAARLSPARDQSFRFNAGESALCPSKILVQRSSAKSTNPAAKKRLLPMAMGGQYLTKYLTAALLAPHRKTANTNPAAMAPLFVFCSTAQTQAENGGPCNGSCVKTKTKTAEAKISRCRRPPVG